MATITRSKWALAAFNEDQDALRQTVDASGTAFEFRDLVTRGSTSGIDKATGGASDDNLALAAEPSTDAYYEPIPSGTGRFGDQSGVKQVLLLDGQDVIANVSGVIAESNFGNMYALAYDSTAGVPVVNLSSASTSGFTVYRLADPVHGGDIGDTDARVVGRLSSDLCL